MIIKVFPDREKAKSIFNLALNRKLAIESIKKTGFPTIIAENYYEVIKEFISIIFLLDGLKATGENAHKELIERFLSYKVVEEFEIKLIDDLRIKRNKSLYDGKQIEKVYLNNNEDKLKEIIKKIEKVIEKRLKN